MSLFTHVITVPPMTDTMQLIGSYRAVMEILGIDCSQLFGFPVNENGITHPVESAQQILVNDFQDTYSMLQLNTIAHGGLTLSNMTFMPGCCVFTFIYED